MWRPMIKDIDLYGLKAKQDEKREAQEVGLYLITFIQNNLRQDVTELRLWSDSCGG